MGGTAFVAAQGSLHLVLTPSQKPTDLLAAGQDFGEALGKLAGMPVRVTVAADYAAVIEALRNRTADLAFTHPVGYVLANREAKATILVRNLWHGKATFTSRIYVRKDQRHQDRWRSCAAGPSPSWIRPARRATSIRW